MSDKILFLFMVQTLNKSACYPNYEPKFFKCRVQWHCQSGYVLFLINKIIDKSLDFCQQNPLRAHLMKFPNLLHTQPIETQICLRNTEPIVNFTTLFHSSNHNQLFLMLKPHGRPKSCLQGIPVMSQTAHCVTAVEEETAHCATTIEAGTAYYATIDMEAFLITWSALRLLKTLCVLHYYFSNTSLWSCILRIPQYRQSVYSGRVPVWIGWFEGFTPVN